MSVLMGPLDQPPDLRLLAGLSLVAATVSTALTSLLIPPTPMLWFIPGAYILTAVYHASILATSPKDPLPPPPDFILPIWKVIGSFFIGLIWVAAGIMLVICSVLRGLNALPMDKHLAFFVVACIFAWLEAVVMFRYAWILHQYRQQTVYRAKWSWKPEFLARSWGL
ncbi:hypothetical protein AX16_002058 [Volvariella volvacea WC 439]|nr:hypothetical protein AX16_002058 [Volvariella volvacea WC 439]